MRLYRRDFAKTHNATTPARPPSIQWRLPSLLEWPQISRLQFSLIRRYCHLAPFPCLSPFLTRLFFPPSPSPLSPPPPTPTHSVLSKVRTCMFPLFESTPLSPVCKVSTGRIFVYYGPDFVAWKVSLYRKFWEHKFGPSGREEGFVLYIFSSLFFSLLFSFLFSFFFLLFSFLFFSFFLPFSCAANRGGRGRFGPPPHGSATDETLNL